MEWNYGGHDAESVWEALKTAGEHRSAFKGAVTNAGCDATVLTEIDWIIRDDMVVRPDVLIVCGQEPPRYLEHTPAVVVEILLEVTGERDLTYKRMVYEEQSVPWYLIVDPNKDQLIVLERDPGDRYTERESAVTLALTICQTCSVELPVAKCFD